MRLYQNGMSLCDYFFYMRPTKPHSQWADYNEEDEEWFKVIDEYFWSKCNHSNGFPYLEPTDIPEQGQYPPKESTVLKKYKWRKKQKKEVVKVKMKPAAVPPQNNRIGVAEQNLNTMGIKSPKIGRKVKSPFSTSPTGSIFDSKSWIQTKKINAKRGNPPRRNSGSV